MYPYQYGEILVISICTSKKCSKVLLADDVRDIYTEKPQK